MVYRGHVSGEVIILPPGIRLPDGTEVLIEPISPAPRETSAAEFALRNGVPVFPRNGQSPPPNLELVNKLRDDTP